MKKENLARAIRSGNASVVGNIVKKVKFFDWFPHQEVLLPHNANLKFLDYALHFAIHVLGRQEPAAVSDEKYNELKLVPVAKVLLDAKADPNCLVYTEKYTYQASALKAAVLLGHGGLVNLLLARGATTGKGFLEGPLQNGGLLHHCFMLSDSENPNARALMAWRLFAAKAPLIKDGFGDDKPMLNDLIEDVVTKQEMSRFIFICTLYNVWAAQKRYPFIFLALQQQSWGKNITNIIISYSDEGLKQNAEVEQAIISHPSVWDPLEEKEPIFTHYKELGANNFVVPQQLIDKFKKNLNGGMECGGGEQTPPPIMLMAAMGKKHAILPLVRLGADPTASFHENSAIIWALHGGRENHIKIARDLINCVKPPTTKLY